MHPTFNPNPENIQVIEKALEITDEKVAMLGDNMNDELHELRSDFEDDREEMREELMDFGKFINITYNIPLFAWLSLSDTYDWVK